MTTALKQEIRRVVRDTMHEELQKFRAATLRAVSEKELREITRQYGRPSRRAVRSVRVRI